MQGKVQPDGIVAGGLHIDRRTSGSMKPDREDLPAAGLHPGRDAPEIGDELLVGMLPAGFVSTSKNGRWVNGHGHEGSQR
jgi:hypothetical protein